jgi:hypothetical protein
MMKGIDDINWHNPPRLMDLARESKSYNLRIERQLTKVKTIRYDFLPNRKANHWNSLTQETVNLTTKNMFKNAIDKLK